MAIFQMIIFSEVILFGPDPFHRIRQRSGPRSKCLLDLVALRFGSGVRVGGGHAEPVAVRRLLDKLLTMILAFACM